MHNKLHIFKYTAWWKHFKEYLETNIEMLICQEKKKSDDEEDDLLLIILEDITWTSQK